MFKSKVTKALQWVGVAALIAATFLLTPVGSQVPSILFGVASSVPTPVTVTSGGSMNVTLAGGTATLNAGSGSDTYKPAGLVCQQLTPLVDASVQSQWNVISCAILANVLSANGAMLHVTTQHRTATNANTKAYQLWYAPSTATCSGSNAAICDAGCNVSGALTTTGSAVGIRLEYNIFRTAAGAASSTGWAVAASTINATGGITIACTVDETAATKIVYGVRNDDAAAASIAAVNLSALHVTYFPPAP